MPDRVLRVECATGSSPSSVAPQTVHLRIEDDASGTPITVLEFTAAEFWRLIQGSSTTVTGFVSGHLDRVGKQQVTHRWTPPDRADSRVYGSSDREDADALAARYLPDALAALGVDPASDYSSSVRRTNSDVGVQVIIWTYEEVPA